MSLFTIILLVPVYGYISDSSQYSASRFDWNYSFLDTLTLANAIDDFDITTLIILMTYLFSFLAYYLLYVICSQMSSLEFYTASTFIDEFVSSHSVIIRGVNTDIGTDEASKKIGKVFEQRFGKQNVISCNTFRKSYPLKKLWQNVKIYKRKLGELTDESNISGETKMIWVGKRSKCNRRQVDGVKWYRSKLEIAEQEWE